MSSLKDFLNSGGTLAPQVNDNTEAIKNKIGQNLLINGDFSVWQRGTTFDLGAGIGTSFTADRWQIFKTDLNLPIIVGDNVGDQGDANNGNIPSTIGAGRHTLSMNIKGDVPNTTVTLRQVIENGIDLLQNQWITYSFWAFVDSGSTYNGAELKVDVCDGLDENFTLQAGWHRYEKTVFMGDLTDSRQWLSGHGWFDFAIQSKDADGVIYFGAVKLEIGQRATEFMPDDPATNLAKCQRYFVTGRAVRGYGVEVTRSGITGIIPFPTTMRTQPVMSLQATDALYLVEFTQLGQSSFDLLIDAPALSGVRPDSNGTDGFTITIPTLGTNNYVTLVGFYGANLFYQADAEI